MRRIVTDGNTAIVVDVDGAVRIYADGTAINIGDGAQGNAIAGEAYAAAVATQFNGAVALSANSSAIQGGFIPGEENIAQIVADAECAVALVVDGTTIIFSNTFSNLSVCHAEFCIGFSHP